jgi:hypothetical protein
MLPAKSPKGEETIPVNDKCSENLRRVSEFEEAWEAAWDSPPL